ncbi:Ribonuclease H-like superfamily [Arabidopsis suecica]|uniref:Ribonuclease H-like superfamily n=1 Tax=Arabidopsis suecica TaxID=45249 RepID=A0A8T2BAA8_ARASU|nr:Ribonuclease H-like superfamily [Arabidopsis suecica]
MDTKSGGKSRNLLVFQQQNLSWENGIALANNDARDWMAANEYLQQLHEPAPNVSTFRQSSRSTQWKKATNGWIKCNYDGSFLNSNVPSKAGWVFRDDSGNFRGAGQAIGLVTSTALESEWQALLIAMQHAWTKGFRRVIFEGDNKQLVDLINQRQLHFASFNWLRDVYHWKLKFEDI